MRLSGVRFPEAAPAADDRILWPSTPRHRRPRPAPPGRLQRELIAFLDAPLIGTPTVREPDIFTKTPARRKICAGLLTIGLVGAPATANAAPASAEMTTQHSGFVSESVYCNSDTHTVETDFMTE